MAHETRSENWFDRVRDNLAVIVLLFSIVIGYTNLSATVTANKEANEALSLDVDKALDKTNEQMLILSRVEANQKLMLKNLGLF